MYVCLSEDSMLGELIGRYMYLLISCFWSYIVVYPRWCLAKTFLLHYASVSGSFSFISLLILDVNMMAYYLGGRLLDIKSIFSGHGEGLFHFFHLLFA